MSPPTRKVDLDDAVAVDAHEGRGLGVHGHGADAAAEPRPLHELVEHDHDDDRADDDEDVDVRDVVVAERKTGWGAMIVGIPALLRELRT